MTTITLDELKKRQLTGEELQMIKDAPQEATDDFPEMTKEELKQFRPWYEVHPNGNDTYKVTVL